MGELAQSSEFTVGEWTVEPNLGRIIRNGEPTVLEPRIMELLVYLAHRAGKTVSTDELAEKVWAGRAVSDQPVYQGIAQLRKALVDEARHPRYIATVTKKGYRLIASVGMPEPEVAPTGIRPRSERQPRFLLPVFSLILAGSYLFLSSSDVSVSRERRNPTPSEFGSIAVLPFVDMSEDRSQQYLGDGIAEEVIHRIAAVPNVRVVARTSSFSFRDSQADVQSIGERLGADVILEGSVRRSGDRLRITAQLVSATDGYHIWSRSYEPVVSDAFIVQDQIALSVAQLLQVGVGELPARSWTENADAAEAYYLGMYYMHKRRAESLDKALQYFQQAVTYDPEFALSYAGLAKSYFLASDERYGNLPDEDAMRKSGAALRLAEALDDRLPEVLERLADEAWDRDNVLEAESLILRAININPNYAPAFKVYGHLLDDTDRWNEALVAWEMAVALDPLSPVMRVNLAFSYVFFNRFPEAEAEILTAIELDPTSHIPYFWLANMLSATDQLARAIELGKKALSTEGPEARWAGHAAMVVGYAYLTLGDFEAAGQWFGKARDLGFGGWRLANPRIHFLLAQDRFAEADALLSHWASEEPDLPNVFSLGGLYRAMMGQEAAAIAMLERTESLPYDGRFSNLFVTDFLRWGYIPAVHLANLYLSAGAEDRARQLLDDADRFIATVDKGSPSLPGVDYVRASVHALQGNDLKAIESLRQAVDNGWSKLWFAERDPIMASYRGDAQFESILDTMRDRLMTERELLPVTTPN